MGKGERDDAPAAGQTDCSEALLRVYEFLDGELGPSECAKIQAHLDECGPCFNEYNLDTTLKSLIKRSCANEHAPDTLRTAIMARISLSVFRVEGG
ncbi:mycothiol system anti-sigma-R factor [Intrasporangium sp.]|uniref:mycothiol system anti-sigma-R factor n=1 Tax=Intrasporangium sp. TaxID=1925024 RepID=UPI00293A899E|nr:mycothiol system anti-sigma-R factor [Intrasporangium sp.]MDV3220018.1 mycothiol system anti-sigma-R factor [Intrasporangium sp.]